MKIGGGFVFIPGAGSLGLRLPLCARGAACRREAENRGGRDAVLGHPVSLVLDHLPGTHVDAEEVAVEEAVQDVGVDGVDERDDGFLVR